MNTTSKAAAMLGRRGGKAGRGEAKRRTSEQYATIQAQAVSVRRALAAIRQRIRSLGGAPNHNFAAGCGWYDLSGAMVGQSHTDATIHVTLADASGGGSLLGVYEWARRGARDSDPMRYRRL